MKSKKNKWIKITKELPPLWEVVEVKLFHDQEIKRARRIYEGHSLYFAQENNYHWIGRVMYWRFIK